VVFGGLVGSVLGFSAGLVAGLLGYGGSIERLQFAVRLPSGVVGLAISLVVFWQYIRWLFLARLGGYRLRLMREA